MPGTGILARFESMKLPFRFLLGNTVNIPGTSSVPTLMNPNALCRILLAACTIAILPSCEGIPGEYGGIPSGGGYGGYEEGADYSNYYSRPVYEGSAGGYFSSSYSRPYYAGSGYGGYGGYSRYAGPRYYHNDYKRYSYNSYGSGHRYSSGHDHNNNYDYDRGRGSSGDRHRSSSSGGEAIRLVKVRDGSDGNVPEGYHSKEYFKNRGISLSKNTYETRDGDRRGYSGSSSNKKKNH